MPLAVVPTTVEARVVRLGLASRDASGHTVCVVLVRALARTPLDTGCARRGCVAPVRR
jgi:hypothetical protein